MPQAVRGWLALAVVLSSLALRAQAQVAASPAGAVARPSIVFITSDDHRFDALGAAGNPAIHTPVLDRLAARGVLFRQATTHVSQCLPVRATLLTGLPPHQHGALSNRHQRLLAEAARPDAFENVPTVPALLRAAGYHTVLVGKWHLAAEPWRSGFAEVKTWLPGGAADYHDPELARGSRRELVKVKGNTQQILGDDAVAFLASPAARQKPFFLWLAFTAPHVPLEPNSRQSRRLYAGKSTAELLPPGFPRGIATGNWHHYYEAVSDLDRQVGRVLAALEKAGLAESTAVVFLGDNGFLMGQRGAGAGDVHGKILPYEGSLRVPLIVSLPGREDLAGPSDLPASSLDVPATLLALAGVPPPAAWAGRDLLAALGRAPGGGFTDAFSEWADEEDERWRAYRVVRTPRHKLIVWKDPSQGAELYNLAADPAEEDNLHGKLEAAAVRRDLEERLRAWMERTEDPARQWAVFGSAAPYEPGAGAPQEPIRRRAGIRPRHSRGHACVLVASPRLLEPECRMLRQMQLAGALCRYIGWRSW